MQALQSYSFAFRRIVSPMLDITQLCLRILRVAIPTRRSTLLCLCETMPYTAHAILSKALPMHGKTRLNYAVEHCAFRRFAFAVPIKAIAMYYLAFPLLY